MVTPPLLSRSPYLLFFSSILFLWLFRRMNTSLSGHIDQIGLKSIRPFVCPEIALSVLNSSVQSQYVYSCSKQSTRPPPCQPDQADHTKVIIEIF